jgi:hypothetical protein
MNHVATFSEEQIRNLLSGSLKIDFRFFSRKSDILNKIHSGDLIFFRKSRGEVLGQFEIEKLIVVEKFQAGDWNWIKEIGKPSEFGLTKVEFEEKADMEKTLLIIQIIKLEQFITPPIEIDKRSKKEWIVLD